MQDLLSLHILYFISNTCNLVESELAHEPVTQAHRDVVAVGEREGERVWRWKRSGKICSFFGFFPSRLEVQDVLLE